MSVPCSKACNSQKTVGLCKTRGTLSMFLDKEFWLELNLHKEQTNNPGSVFDFLNKFDDFHNGLF